MNFNTRLALLTSLFLLVESKLDLKNEEELKCFDNICVPIYNSKLTWYEAKDFCEKKSALLATISSHKEDEEIKNVIDEGKYWIGLNSLNPDVNFIWLDKTDRRFHNLKEDPKNIDATEKKCIYIDNIISSYNWNNAHCEEKMMFICKKPVGEIRPFPVLPSGNCPSDWYQLNPFCYKLFNGPLDWKNAKLNCKSLGKAYDLASIHDFRQHMLLASFLQNDTWIGGTFLKNSKQKIWSDNTPFDYDRFKFVSSDLDQNTNNLCFQMSSDDYKLGSLIAVNCTEEKPYICRTYVDNLISKPPTLAPDKCENDKYKMISYQDNCYYLHKEKMEWNKGERFCEAFGPHLAIIADAKENAFVNFYLGLSENDVWIGLTGDQSQYKWFNNWPLNFTNWMDDQPMNLNNINQCGLIDGKTGKWKVTKCEGKNWILCRLTDTDLPVIQEDKRTCPVHAKNWKETKEGFSCYKVFDKELDWNSAVKECQEHKASLISFHSFQEMKSISQDLKSFKSVWIGLSRRKDEGYKWQDESVLDFVSWKSKPMEEEGCVEMNLPDQTWENSDCNAKKPFICGVKTIISTEENNVNRKNTSNSGLSPGSIAAICIGVIIVVLIIINFVLWRKGVLKKLYQRS